ncbi:hypothetical protein, partial [Xanthomonas vesicatoria]
RDLLFGKTRLLHRLIPRDPRGPCGGEVSTLRWHGFSGVGQLLAKVTTEEPKRFPRAQDCWHLEQQRISISLV